MQYFRGMDIIYTKHFAVFSGDGCYVYYALRSIFGGGYYFYYAIHSIFGGWILFILCTSQYFRGCILFKLCNTQYFRGMDTIYTMHYAVFSGDGYYLFERSELIIRTLQKKSCVFLCLFLCVYLLNCT